MENFYAALGQTLIHSLWQGAILAGITGLIVVLTRTTKAANRYLLMVGVMVLFVVVCAGTFVHQLSRHAIRSQTSAHLTYETGVISGHSMVASSLQGRVIQYVDNNIKTIVVLWCVVVLVRSLQLAISMRGLSHLRHRNIFGVDDIWVERVAALASRLGVGRVVGIAESGIAKVPMVIGHLKPLILVPTGLLTALSPAEVEAILLHELAHIQRRDYLVNLLQSFLEVIFFFNPAVLWLSALIRKERENCCDDITVAQTGNKVNYIRALVSFQEYQLSAPAYVTAFSGRRSHLVDRVKRMASGTNHVLNFKERCVLMVMLFTTGLLTVAFTSVKQVQQFAAKSQKAITHAIVSSGDPIVTQSGQPARKVNTIRNKAETDTRKIQVTNTDEGKPMRQNRPASEDGGENTYSLPATSVTPPNPGNVLGPVDAAIKPLAPLKERSEPYKPTYKGYPANAAKKHVAYPVTTQQSKPTISDRITAELIKDKIISGDDKHISFKLSNFELVVNGIRQSDEVQKRYKDKFVPATNDNSTWTLYNNYDTSTETRK
ncbi:hypothetical protein C7T94_11630 [Pedobacter yulinensis]|uniref:Peptidase M56 domain-containing protein n=1 Tax=Pedobacter yulinensis TaxID=2126353 RepID=A0A2T3HLB3_9SPHI|nr:M56 family metallopeptidase [Pedobacter yulinensis]PST83237.1 hypothetical protein C7T94_11630 [Pedobacter yulinensis]